MEPRPRIDSGGSRGDAAPMDERDVALGLAVGGIRAGAAAGRFALLPVRLAAKSPVVGPALRRMGREVELVRSM